MTVFDDDEYGLDLDGVTDLDTEARSSGGDPDELLRRPLDVDSLLVDLEASDDLDERLARLAEDDVLRDLDDVDG